MREPPLRIDATKREGFYIYLTFLKNFLVFLFLFHLIYFTAIVFTMFGENLSSSLIKLLNQQSKQLIFCLN